MLVALGIWLALMLVVGLTVGGIAKTKRNYEQEQSDEEYQKKYGPENSRDNF